jgi:hypothetical protein
MPGDVDLLSTDWIGSFRIRVKFAGPLDHRLGIKLRGLIYESVGPDYIRGI